MEEIINASPERAPKYHSIYNSLRRDILLGKYPSGSFLPTENELMVQFDAGRNTVRHALALLRDEGLASAQQGSGVRVNQISLTSGNRVCWTGSEINIEYLRPFSTIESSPIAADVCMAPVNVCAAMKIAPGSEVLRLQRIRKIDGAPFNYTVHYINTVLYPRAREIYDSGVSLDKLAEKACGGECEVYESFSCKSADLITASLLGLDSGAAVLYTCRTTEYMGNIVEYGEFYGNPAFFRYRAKIR